MLAPGRYALDRPLRLPAGFRLTGRPGAELVGRAGGGPLVVVEDADGVRIEGVTFRGGGILLTGRDPDIPNRRIRIADCRFLDIAADGFGEGDGIFSATGLVESVLVGNVFTGIGGEGSAIRIYHADRVSIAGNRFDTVFQGITLHWDRRGGHGVRILGNRGDRVRRMGIELVGDPPVGGIVVAGNRIAAPLDPGPGSFGLSIAVDGSVGSQVLDNEVVADDPGPLGRLGYGIEVGGRDAVVRGNRVAGPWAAGIALGEAPGASVSDNRLCLTGGHGPKGLDSYLGHGVAAAGNHVRCAKVMGTD